MCDENDEVYDLISDIDDYGRRKVDTVDKEYAAELVKNASGFLIDQVKDDGSFVYGYYPRFDKNIDNYNIVRHASTLWSLVCQYRMTGNEELVPVIDRAIDYMVENAIVERNGEISYLYEEKSDEIKLGGCGVAVVALTEYMDAFGSDKYKDLAIKLGNGILTMLDQNSGEYYHVLDGEFIKKSSSAPFITTARRPLHCAGSTPSPRTRSGSTQQKAPLSILSLPTMFSTRITGWLIR